MQLSSMSPTQGLSQHPFVLSPTSPASTRGFKRSASSDEEQENGDDARPSSSRRNTAVKRACNECRQQKVSHAGPPAAFLRLFKTLLAGPGALVEASRLP
jgi:hypothetical protein